MKRRALLLGGSGQLGSELRRQGHARWEITAPERLQLDVRSSLEVATAVSQLKPDLVLNCSAFHVVDLCESRFADALAVNAVAVLTLAQAAERIGARFVTISTDYAFDGTSRVPYRETNKTNPIQAYGISKVAGEQAALSAHPEGAFVIRSCGLYGRAASRQKSGNFVLNRLTDGRTKQVVEVGSDLVCAPTAASDLAGAILLLLEREATAGLYHLTNSGFCDWAAFTAEIFRQARLAARVVPVDRGGRYTPARRPAYSVLDCERASAFGVIMRPWQEAVGEYVASVT